MHITFISFWYPYPADNGAKMRALAMIRALAREHCVDLIVLGAEERAADDLEPLRQLCRSIVTIATPVFLPQARGDWRGFLGAIPRSLVNTYDPRITALLERRISARECDVVICGERAAYYGLKVAHSVAVFVDDVDPSRYADAIRNARDARSRLRATLTDWKYRRFIRSIENICAGLLVASEREARLLCAITAHAARIAVVPNGVILTEPAMEQARDARRLVYSGSPTYAPNRDATTFFAADILPRLRERIPDAWLAITGTTEGVSLDDLTAVPGVTFTGWLADIRSYIAASRVCVVPLRQGGGTRLKILEAMALGTPVVATTKGAEGLDLTTGEDILIADDPDAFADATARLLTDDTLYARIAAHAKETVATRYDWEIIGTEMLDTLTRLTSRWEAQQWAHGPAALRHHASSAGTGEAMTLPQNAE